MRRGQAPAPQADILPIGRFRVWPPVVLAPMAGITNASFRRLCREFGAGLYVCEMVTTRALVERDAKTMAMVRFTPDEQPRSLQLYGVDPDVVGRAVRMVVDEDLADHIDLNFGCPVPKVTRRGGGSALPYKRRLFESIVRRAVSEAAPAGIPVTVKMRIGIDPEHITYLQAGRIAEDNGAAAVALHGRTAIQHYSGTADWSAIARLKQTRHLDPGAGQRGHLQRRRRPAHDGRDRLRRSRCRPRLPGPALAVRRPRRRLRRGGPADGPEPARGDAGCCGGTPNC